MSVEDGSSAPSHPPSAGGPPRPPAPTPAQGTPLPAARGGARYATLASFKEENAALARDEFLRRHPFPVLILETKEGNFEAVFQTISVKPESSMAKTDLKRPPADPEKTDLDIQVPPGGLLPPPEPKPPEIAKKPDEPRTVFFVVFLAKRAVNKFASMITVGRAANNDVRINCPSVSKFHAYFTHVQRDGTWFLTDANSSNGTWVDGERLRSDKARAKVSNGSAIRLGPDVVGRFFDPAALHQFLAAMPAG